MRRLAQGILCWGLMAGGPALAQQAVGVESGLPVLAAGYRPGSLLKAVPVYLQRVDGGWSASLTGDLKDSATELVEIPLSGASAQVMTTPMPGVKRLCLTKMKDRSEFGYLECNSAFLRITSPQAKIFVRFSLQDSRLPMGCQTEKEILLAKRKVTLRQNNIILKKKGIK